MSQPRGGVVLLYIGPGLDGEFDRSMLECFGHPVTVCSGPEEHALCPVVSGHGCRQYEEAHGIVFDLDLERPEHRAILRSYRDMGPAELPIRVVCTPEQAGRFADVLRDVEVWGPRTDGRRPGRLRGGGRSSRPMGVKQSTGPPARQAMGEGER